MATAISLVDAESVLVEQNQLAGNQIGVRLSLSNFTAATLDSTTIQIKRNNLSSDSEAGIKNEIAADLVDGQCNWWGDANGDTATCIITNVSDTPPTITSDGSGTTASLTRPENSTGVTTVAASGSVPLTFSIVGGADGLAFTIDNTTGVLTFLAPPDFEAPADSDLNNLYEVIVRATNGGGADDQTITVTITDVLDTPATPNKAPSSL